MSERVGNVAVIQRTTPARCEFCGQVTELRPYGPKNENICVECARKDPVTTDRKMKEHLFQGTVVTIANAKDLM